MSAGVPLSLLDRLARSHSSATNRLALLIWIEFVSAVIATLRKAEARLRDPSFMTICSAKTGWWRRKAQRNKARQLVRLPNEDAITHALTCLLQDIRGEAGEGDPVYAMNIVFDSQQPRRTQTRIGANALTTDIRAFVPENPELDLRIEAKVLFKEDDLDLEYCSERGIRRFGDPENPYTDQIIGAMLGYSLTPSLAAWYGNIGKHLGGVADVSDIGFAAIAGEAGPTLVCDVIRQDGSGRLVTVLHLLMEFDTEPPSRPPGT